MTKPSNIESIEKATKKTWDEWMQIMKDIGATELDHTTIAKKVNEIIKDGWWAQAVTVAFEQQSGKREPGQRADGTFEMAVSKSFDGSIDDVFAKWITYSEKIHEFDRVGMATPPTTSGTEKQLHWGCKLEDGSRVDINVDTYGKPVGKAGLTITHSRLKSSEIADRWRAYWKKSIAGI